MKFTTLTTACSIILLTFTPISLAGSWSSSGNITGGKNAQSIAMENSKTTQGFVGLTTPYYPDNSKLPTIVKNGCFVVYLQQGYQCHPDPITGAPIVTPLSDSTGSKGTGKNIMKLKKPSLEDISIGVEVGDVLAKDGMVNKYAPDPTIPDAKVVNWGTKVEGMTAATLNSDALKNAQQFKGVFSVSR